MTSLKRAVMGAGQTTNEVLNEYVVEECRCYHALRRGPPAVEVVLRERLRAAGDLRRREFSRVQVREPGREPARGSGGASAHRSGSCRRSRRWIALAAHDLGGRCGRSLCRA